MVKPAPKPRRKVKRRPPSGPRYNVDTHPKRRQAIRDLSEGVSRRTVAKRYGLSRGAIDAFFNRYLAPHAADVMEARGKDAGEAMLAEIEHVMGRMRMLYDACHEYLLDPKDCTRYELGPRGTDIEVVCETTQGDGKKPLRESVKLQTILNRLERNGVSVVDVRTKHADPRELIVKTADALTRQLEVVAKVMGLVKESTITIMRIEEWTDIKTLIVDATKDSPEVRQRIIDGLARVTSE